MNFSQNLCYPLNYTYLKNNLKKEIYSPTIVLQIRATFYRSHPNEYIKISLITLTIEIISLLLMMMH